MQNEDYMVIFQPSGRRGSVPKGVSIVEAARLLGVGIETLCGGRTVCGKCIVRIEAGRFEKFGITTGLDHVSPWQEAEGKFINAEQKAAGFRLGCQARVFGDLLVYVPEASRACKQVISKAARDIKIDLNPAVRHYHLKLDPPVIEEPLGDFERVGRDLEKKYGLKDLTIDLFALRQLPRVLRQGDWQVTVSVWNQKEIICVRPGTVKRSYGFAIDVGTTTVAAYLCDLNSGHVVDTVSMMNPQCKYGEDVMSRITYHRNNPGGLQRMRDDIIAGLNQLIDRALAVTHPPKPAKTILDASAPVEADATGNSQEEYLCLQHDDIHDLAIVFNTVMHHIFLEIDPAALGRSPFPPAIHHSLNIKARDLGININPAAYVFVLPNEAGFVGADNVGVLLAEQPHKGDLNQLIIDIGTNGELVLGNRHKLISSSCATGPALEGAQLSCGMRAAPGAIERIAIDSETKEVDYKVIGRQAWRKFSGPEDMHVRGICGSGVLDLLAELFRTGIIDKGGAFNRKTLNGHPRLRKNPSTGMAEFVLAWSAESAIENDIVITQKDIRQMQLAKGALYAGCKLMIKRLGLKQVDLVKIAGAFGTHIDRVKALIAGLFPDCRIENIQSVGNAAGDGCRAALLNVAKREEADWYARNVEYIELTTEPNFQREFVAAMSLPHMYDDFPHLEGIVPADILRQ
jgi:uncharacterized 2Fe-2S/4Fe-4S cluster protein (DUF4445 family)